MDTGAVPPGGHVVSADGVRIRDVVRDVVARLAPEEMPVVTALAGLDEDVALRRLRRGGRREDPLGFGLGEVAALVAPVVWVALDGAVRRIGDAAGEGAAKGMRSVARRLFRRRSAPAVMPTLTREQLGQVWQLVLETAGQRGLSAQRATTIADAVVARLALTAPDPDTQRLAGPDDPANGDAPAEEAPPTADDTSPQS
ncbi:hypothetical protein [Streptomyces sp. NPDC093707]|uniref:hypothetical protein n=1 Tax=Streptomyces sp. NPDC093707 TaxID=3154984 RepID=UPI00344DD33E